MLSIYYGAQVAPQDGSNNNTTMEIEVLMSSRSHLIQVVSQLVQHSFYAKQRLTGCRASAIGAVLKSTGRSYASKTAEGKWLQEYYLSAFSRSPSIFRQGHICIAVVAFALVSNCLT